MSDDALFLNGVYESVLIEIFTVQSVLPEQIMFLQPYSNRIIRNLQANSPSVEFPMRIYFSLTNDLANIHYQAEIVGWEDKRILSNEKRGVITTFLDTFQKNESGLYNATKSGTGESVNLLHIWRLQKLKNPFSVSSLIKISNNEPVSTKRETAGGWIYVKKLS